jgi:uncharacterized protein (TIGR02271 family)
MAKTIIGLFDTAESAERAVRDLLSRGFSRDDVSVVSKAVAGGDRSETAAEGDNEESAERAGAGAVGGTMLGGGLGLLVGLGMLAIPGIGPVVAAGTLAAVLGSTALGAGIGAAAGGLIGVLVGSGVPEEEAQVYAEGVRRGGTLVTITSSDEMADEAVAALEASDPVNLEQRKTSLRQSGWERFDPQGAPYPGEDVSSQQSNAPASPTPTAERPVTQAAGAVLPVIEEELVVGKREVQGGRVRVHTRVSETPVEEQVQLREERVHVERHPVSRDVAPGEAGAFNERSFELHESAEEAVVSKQARVVEEVVVDKDVQEHVETVRDTVRRTDVDVEQVATGPTRSGADYQSYENDFRSHYQQSFARSGYSYDDYTPVYRYGHALATDAQYRDHEWADVEPNARATWEKTNPNTWNDFKDGVHYAWDKARGHR